MPSLTIGIPSRNEEFLKNTVDTILANMRGDTEIIVVCDGAWPIVPIPQHPRVTLIYHPESIGQRAATNEAARISSADYFMKLDAHCMVDEGFDVKLMQPYEDGELDRTVTTMPRLYNLHAFDWVCPECGRHFYQGPVRTECGIRNDKGEKQLDAGGQDSGCWYTGEFKKELVWQPRFNRGTDHMRFDNTMHFQYWRDFKRRPEAKHTDFPELFGNLGACVFMKRDRFWELGGMDEEHGSWGQFGTEVSCKAWLSGGRQVTNRRTWFSHLFRTQKGFSFPYEQNNKQVDHAREYSRDLWLNNKWPQQVRPLSWLIRHFWPVPDWPDPGPAPTMGCVYYTDNRLDPSIFNVCQRQLTKAVNGHKLVTTSIVPMNFGLNVEVPGTPSRHQMFKQILTGLETIDTDYVFLCEHDVIYHPSHFDFIPPRDDTFYYNTNVWHVPLNGPRAVKYDTHQVAALCANRQLLLDYYRKLVAVVEVFGYDHKWGYEPGTWGARKGFIDLPTREWQSAGPNIDIRHSHNLTASRWSPDSFKDKNTCLNWQEADTIPVWDIPVERFPIWLQEQR